VKVFQRGRSETVASHMQSHIFEVQCCRRFCVFLQTIVYFTATESLNGKWLLS